MNSFQLLLNLIRFEVNGERNGIPEDLTFDFHDLLKLSERQSMSHLVADSLIKCSLIEKDSEEAKILNRIVLNEAYRLANNENVLNSTSEIFDNEKIDYIPLKGSIIRNYYPEPWMRTSCDTDILIHDEDFDKAISALEEKGFIVEGDRSFHDIVLHLGKAILELHFTICENQGNIDPLLEKAWEYAESNEGSHRFTLNKDYFAFHIIAHMSHHFLSGGCGIKPFVDLWLLKKNNLYNEERVVKFCKDCSLEKFYYYSCKLISAWFEDGEMTDELKKMERYIISGGTYGSFSNLSAVGTSKSKGKIGFFLKRVFLSKSSMEIYYPVIKKHKYLLPFMYLKRIFDNIFNNNKSKDTKEKMKTIFNSKNNNDISELLNTLGL